MQVRTYDLNRINHHAVTHHHLKASVANCHWGYFDATRAPVLTVKSGDIVTIDTVSGQAPATIPKSGFYIPPELLEIHAHATGYPLGPHILTGPIAVEGAKPGRVLEVRIREIKLRQDWGYNVIRPLAGTVPDDFPEMRLIHIPLDHARNVATLSWGLELPLAPFFGILGMARRRAGAASPRLCRAPMAATSTTKNSSRALRSICRFSSRAGCSPAATGTPCREMAKSASPPSRPRCRER